MSPSATQAARRVGGLRRASLRGRTGSTSVTYGFSGMPYEGGTLIYAGARRYDPATGRFLQTDPAGLMAPNLYAYAIDDPYLYTENPRIGGD
ncbi:MAG TPA: RHS repeat-associated core domain-containing protein [Myxococcota bacterium]